MRCDAKLDCSRCAMQVGWMDLGVALCQAIFRQVLGYMTGSAALSVQGMSSIADLLTKSMNLITAKLAKRPPSKSFPFGFGKIQFVSPALIGLTLFAGGLYLGVNNVINIDHLNKAPGSIALLGVAVSGAASEFMSRYQACVARRNKSIAIQAAAIDNRLDAIASVCVFGGILISELGLPIGDRLAAILISILVVRAGAKILLESIKGLLDVSISQETLADISRTCRLTVGIRDVELVRGRSLGDTWEIYVQAAVDDQVTAAEVQLIVDAVKKRIRAQFPQVGHVWLVTVPRKAADDDDEDYWQDHLFTSIPRS